MILKHVTLIAVLAASLFYDVVFLMQLVNYPFRKSCCLGFYLGEFFEADVESSLFLRRFKFVSTTYLGIH